MKRFIILFVICFIFCTVLIFSMSCSKSDQTYTIEIKDGVNYVHNNAPLWGDEPRISLEFVRQIGELDTDDENLQFYRPRDIAFDNEDNMYILDSGNYRIQKFNKEGNYILTIGRKGQGPSEFMSPTKICIDEKNNIYVRDTSKRYIVVLNPEGKQIRQIEFAGLVIDNFAILSTGDFVVCGNDRNILRDLEKEYTTQILKIFDNKSKLINEFGNSFNYGDRITNMMGNVIYFALDNSDNIYITFRHQNRVEKFSSDGKIIFASNRPLNYEISRPKQIIDLQTGFEIDDLNNVSEAIGIDHKGRIWISTIRNQKYKSNGTLEYDIEIYNDYGVLLCKIPFEELPETAVFKKVNNDRIYLIESRNEMCVYEYKIVDK